LSSFTFSIYVKILIKWLNRPFPITLNFCFNLWFCFSLSHTHTQTLQTRNQENFRVEYFIPWIYGCPKLLSAALLKKWGKLKWLIYIWCAACAKHDLSLDIGRVSWEFWPIFYTSQVASSCILYSCYCIDYKARQSFHPI
jgi:hypothetical protein